MELTSVPGKSAGSGGVGNGMPTMSESEAWSFLEASPARPGVLATTRADGRPHAAPIWYAVDGRSIVFNTGVRTVKGRNLQLDPRVTLVVDDDRPPFSFVIVSGSVTLCEELEDVRRWASVIGGRYMGEDRAEAYGARNGVPGELLVRIRPEIVNGARDIAD